MAISFSNNNERNSTSEASGALSYAKVFGYVGIGLLITAAISFGLGYLWIYLASIGKFNNDIMFGIMIGSAIVTVILTLAVQFILLKGEHSILVPAILYCVVMGVLLSSFVLYIDWKILGTAFGITAGTFLLMGLIAFFTKGNFSVFGNLAIGLIIGGAILAVINLFARSTPLYWIIEFAIFGAVLLITAFDMWNVKRIIDDGYMSKNIALYCAFTIYVDFIGVFIRIIYFLVIASQNN